MRFLSAIWELFINIILIFWDFFGWLFRAMELDYLFKDLPSEISWGIRNLKIKMFCEGIILMASGIFLVILEWNFLLPQTALQIFVFLIITLFTLRMTVRFINSTFYAYWASEELYERDRRDHISGHF